MKNKMTVDKLKALIKEFIILEQNEMEDSTEWAYVNLEPELTKNEDIILEFLKQMTQDEFITIANNSWFEDVLCKFNSIEMLNIIKSKWNLFFANNDSSQIPFFEIDKLNNCIKL